MDTPESSQFTKTPSPFLSITAIIISIIAILISIVIVFIPRPVINDEEISDNRSYSNKKTEELIDNLQNQIDQLKILINSKASSDTITQLQNSIAEISSAAGEYIWNDEERREEMIETIKEKIVTQNISNLASEIANSTQFKDFVKSDTTIIDAIKSDDNFILNVANNVDLDNNIKSFFDSSKSNTIDKIIVKNIIVNESLKPNGNPLLNTVDIQATRLLPVSSTKYTNNNNGFWVWYADNTQATPTSIGYGAGLWGRMSWINPSNVGTVKKSFTDFNFSVMQLNDNRGNDNPSNVSSNQLKRDPWLSIKCVQEIKGKNSNSYIVTTNDTATTSIAPSNKGYGYVKMSNHDRRLDVLGLT